MGEQLGLALPSIPALGRDDFMVTPANALAVALIEGWQGWTAGKLLLCGPEGAGKTHLSHVWARESGATILAARDLPGKELPALAAHPLVVEDVHGIAGEAEAEAALFHLHNLMLAGQQPLLMTGEGLPATWPIGLPDLASRLAGTPVAQLEAPDDTLLAAVLAKLFADRQLTPAPDVIAYLLRRMDRSFAAARDLVNALDAASLAQKRPVTRQLASRVLDKKD